MEKLNRIIENYPPELKMVLVCCGDKRRKAEDLIGNINWDLFLKLINRHRLNTYIYKFIKNNSVFFPKDVLNKINNKQLKAVTRSLLLVSELVKVGKILNSNNIKWLAIKGPALSVQLYNEPTFRQSVDIDMLFDSCDLLNVIDLLQKNNYKIVTNIPNNIRSINNFLKFISEISFISPNSNIPIEIHWKFAPYQKPDSINFNKLYAEKETIIINDFEIPTLNFIEHFKYVCRHGFQHQWNSLYWLVDVGQFIKITGTDLPKTTEKNSFISAAINLYSFLFNNININYNKDLKFALESIAIPQKGTLRNLKWRIRRGIYFSNIDKSTGSLWYYLRYLIYKFSQKHSASKK